MEQPFLKSQKVIWKPKGYATIRGIETAEADEAIAKEAVDARVTDNNETSSENSNRLSALFVAKTAKAKHPLGVVSNVDNATYSEPKIGAYFCLKFENEKPNQEVYIYAQEALIKLMELNIIFIQCLSFGDYHY